MLQEARAFHGGRAARSAARATPAARSAARATPAGGRRAAAPAGRWHHWRTL